MTVAKAFESAVRLPGDFRKAIAGEPVLSVDNVEC